MGNKHGDFIWYELLTGNPDAAGNFYGDVLGWRTADSGQAGMDYRIVHAPDVDAGGENPVGGMLRLDPAMAAGGVRPTWLGYVAVDDVDGFVGNLVKAGGAVSMPPRDIPDVGRIAMVADPEGAPLYVLQQAGDYESVAFAHDKPRPGHCAWNELATSDPKAALRFYGDLFGWEKDGEMDMGPMGAYEFLRHGAVFGAISPCLNADGRPGWTYYFRVEDIDAAVKRVEAGGGKVVNGPMEIPGDEFIIHGIDPEGAGFALVGARS